MTKYDETYRPQFHITPNSGWLNDPNGLVYYEGEYHLFYQYFPDSKFPADLKYWAHVVSGDLVHWNPLPVALAPDEYGSMWSGSATVDFNNSTGLFSDTESKSGLVAFYTCTDTNDGLRQQQSLAYSKDNGRTWIKYNGGRPIITSADDPLHDGAFRDPQVFWHEESGQWFMIVAGGPVRFFSSKNLIDWKPEGMQPKLNTECPDFYRMPIDGDESRQKWVLSGGGMWYMLGEFDCVDGVWQFIPDDYERIDFNRGTDTYAGITFNDLPNNRRVKVDWMVDICYPFQSGEITDPYNGVLTLPYEMQLKTIDGKLKIVHTAIKELTSLRTKTHKLSLAVDGEHALELNLKEFELCMNTAAPNADEWGFVFRSKGDQQTALRYDVKRGLLRFDRTHSGKKPLIRHASDYVYRVPNADGKLDIHMIVDRSSVEMFINGEVYTFLIFPDADSIGMKMYSKGGEAKMDMTFYELEPIAKKL